MPVCQKCLRVLLASLIVLVVALPAWSGAVLKRSSGDAMPIYTRSITARADIAGQFAATTLVMVFQNESDEQTEADFIYALPPGAVATYFAYWAGDEKVEAKVVEKKEAARIYERLTTVSRDPALVEFTGKNTFRARISPVFADQDLKVEIRYVQVLPSSGDSISYSVSVTPADANQPDPLESVDVAVNVKPDGRITSITNNYGIAGAEGPSGCQIALKAREFRARKELTVRITRRPRPLQADVRVERAPGNSGYFSLALTPDHSLKRPRVTVSGVGAGELAPARLPDVRAGRTVVINGRYRSSGRATVSLSGQGASGRKTYSTQVNFAAASPPAIAAKLWAAARISDLGTRKGTRKSIIALSFRYGMPSKHTSWLAVPKAEMERVESEKAWGKLQSMAERLAAMVADGRKDTPNCRALRAQYDVIYRQLDPEQDEDDWMLIEALRVKAREATSKIVALRHASKPDRSAESTWKARAERVVSEAASIHPDANTWGVERYIRDAEDEWAHGERARLASRLISLTMAGKGSTREALQTRERYDRLMEAHPGYSWEAPLASRASDMAEELASRIVDERHKPRPNAKLLNELRAKMDRLTPLVHTSPDEQLRQEERYWADRKCSAEAEAYALAVGQGRTQAAEYHARQHKELTESARPYHNEDGLKWALDWRFTDVAGQYAAARRDPTAKPAAVKRLYDEAARLAKASGGSIEEIVNADDAWNATDRLCRIGSSLNSELGRQQPMSSRVERLRKDVQATAQELKRLDKDGHYAREAGEYNAAVDQAISAWLEEQKLNAQDGAVQQADLVKAAEQRKRTQGDLWSYLHYVRSSIRGGDPLISVEAPEDALRVIALLPNGEVKALAWNPANRRWEVRFDVPTGTPDGDYVVTIVVMLADGTRKLSTVSYKVDTTPPSGTAAAVVCDGQRSLRLEIEPSEELARVAALLPWGERVEMHKSASSQRFVETIRVPAGSAVGKVEFVLTDNAHNRASVFADVSAR